MSVFVIRVPKIVFKDDKGNCLDTVEAGDIVKVKVTKDDTIKTAEGIIIDISGSTLVLNGYDKDTKQRIYIPNIQWIEKGDLNND